MNMDTITLISGFAVLILSVIGIVMVCKYYPSIETYSIVVNSYELEYNGSWFYTMEEFLELKKFFYILADRSRMSNYMFETNDFSLDNTYLLIMTKFIDYLRVSIISQDQARSDNLLHQLSIHDVYSCLCEASSNKKKENMIKDKENNEFKFISHVGPFTITIGLDIVDQNKIKI